MEMGVQAVKRVREWANASGVAVGAFEPGEEVRSDREVEEWIRENGNLIYHPTSSCAMGLPNSSFTVLDSHARVLGVNGLRVVDASAFPFCPPGHPMATVYMLAERIADYILRGE
ncbi:MAG: hypothetical protein L6R40_007193 [Gallowayella cf. fulva]|nr:MAG: hypothetical protein L6R40_007193 [Xanthomendoza cf. fulva]